ncbi:MAG: hydroxyethylthiazole kinase, partial [Gemmiger qucibialis]
AQKLGCVVLLSGTEDLIADGQQLCTVRGGSDRMRTVTGAGCMLSVLCGAFAAVQPGDAFTAAVQAARFWKACAEQAEDHAAGAGSFRVALFDAAGNMTDEVFAGE